MPSYYVDATGGNDGDDGLSPGAAWQTMGKVNGETFVAGDSVLFKRGETWVGTALVVAWSGAVGNAITFADYDTGAKPVIDGNDAVNCINVSTKHDLIFRNLDATQGLDAGFNFSACNDVLVDDCDAHDHGNDGVLFITACFDCAVRGGEFYNGYQRVPGTIVTGLEITNGCHDILFTGVFCYDNTGTGGIFATGCGISIHSHDGLEMPYNIEIENAVCHGNSGYGIQILKFDDTDDTIRDIVVRDCLFHDNHEGIRVYKSAGAANYPNGVTLVRCHSYSNTNRAYYFQGDNITLGSSVLEGQGLATECTDLSIHDCTFYFTEASFQYPIYLSGARADVIAVKNNIIHRWVAAGGEAVIGVDVAVVSVNIDIDYNLYYLQTESVLNIRWNWKGVHKNWADWLTDSGQDANSPMADQDPLFLDAPNANFYLDHGSPALQVGTPLAGVPFYGAAPDCGRWEMRWKSQRTEQLLEPAWKFA